MLDPLKKGTTRGLRRHGHDGSGDRVPELEQRFYRLVRFVRRVETLRTGKEWTVFVASRLPRASAAIIANAGNQTPALLGASGLAGQSATELGSGVGSGGHWAGAKPIREARRESPMTDHSKKHPATSNKVAGSVILRESGVVNAVHGPVHCRPVTWGRRRYNHFLEPRPCCPHSPPHLSFISPGPRIETKTENHISADNMSEDWKKKAADAKEAKRDADKKRAREERKKKQKDENDPKKAVVDLPSSIDPKKAVHVLPTIPEKKP